jgi:hypothetical protein
MFKIIKIYIFLFTYRKVFVKDNKFKGFYDKYDENFSKNYINKL